MDANTREIMTRENALFSEQRVTVLGESLKWFLC